VEATPPALRVKNTFLEGGAQLSPSLEHFYQARAMQTCPSKQSGCIKGLFEKAPSKAVEVSTTPLATPLAIETPLNIETPLASEGFHACTYQPPCELFPSFAMPSQVSVLLPELQCRGADFAVPVVAPAIQAPCPAQEGHLAARTVLSLAAALGPVVVPAQQSGLSIEPEPWMRKIGDVRLDSQGPVVSQMLGASVDDFALNLCAPSHPPPPPPGPALGTAELPSIGSSDHAAGCCVPCAFVHTKGCESGLACKFCHLCGPEERKRRRQAKLQERRELQKARQEGQKARVEASE